MKTKQKTKWKIDKKLSDSSLAYVGRDWMKGDLKIVHEIKLIFKKEIKNYE